jgi:hypothetical protein
MPLPIYLAMTAAEFEKSSYPPPKIAWMACHFSAYGTGLSNFPTALPEGSILIVNDRIPICGHDPALIAEQLQELVDSLGCSRVLLDFQRPTDGETAALVKAVLETVPCPVATSPRYAEDLSCPVFLPPVPLLQSPQDYLQPWNHREIWLELAREEATYTVTEDGCVCHPMEESVVLPHTDENLCCRYAIAPLENRVDFPIRKDLDMLIAALEKLPQVTCLVGLYQELG